MLFIDLLQYLQVYISGWCIEVSMRLKTIAISKYNYEILKQQGKAADSFNDVITVLLKKAGITENEQE